MTYIPIEPNSIVILYKEISLGYPHLIASHSLVFYLYTAYTLQKMSMSKHKYSLLRLIPIGVATSDGDPRSDFAKILRVVAIISLLLKSL